MANNLKPSAGDIHQQMALGFCPKTGKKMTIRMILVAVGAVALLSTAHAATAKSKRTANSNVVQGKPRKLFMRKGNKV